MAGIGIVPTGGEILVNIFDGRRQPYSDSSALLLTIRDGNQGVVSREEHSTPSTLFRSLKIFNNFADNYTVLAAADGYQDAGFFPVHISPNTLQSVDLMLLPSDNEINFAAATWTLLRQARPKMAALFAAGVADDNAAGQRYSDTEDAQEGEPLACLLNISTAMDQIQLPQGTVLDYFKTVLWDRLAPDRFFAFADARILDQVKTATAQGVFEPAPFILHPGATSSFKQTQFGEANVQLTFHENDGQEIDGVNCVLVEPDIDYFKDSGAHLLLEVVVNAFGSITDPRTVYALRWIAGRRAGVPEFDPLYTIEKA